jgi:RNA polymerase-binding transcription factor DksA
LSPSINDIEEIFIHIKQLKEEQSLDLKNTRVLEQSDNVNLLIDNDKNFTNINQFNGKNNQIVTKMDQDFGICDMCKEEIIFEKNLSGLIVLDKIFICEKCSQNKSDRIINNWIHSKMANLEDVKPIALWLMQKKNKKRLV